MTLPCSLSMFCWDCLIWTCLFKCLCEVYLPVLLDFHVCHHVVFLFLLKITLVYAYTLGPRDYNTGGYDLSVITTLKPLWQIFFIDSNVICPVIMIFCIDFFSNYNLKMSKIMIFYFDFLWLQLENDQNRYLYQTTIPSYWGVLEITIKFGGELTPPEPKMVIF